MYTCTHAHTHKYVQLTTAETDTSTFMRPQTVVALANALRYQVVSVFLCYWDVIFAQKEQKQLQRENLSSLQRFMLGYRSG